MRYGKLRFRKRGLWEARGKPSGDKRVALAVGEVEVRQAGSLGGRVSVAMGKSAG